MFTGPDAFQTAKRKARYGHNDWLYWKGKDGTGVAARKSAETMKACLLASGTKKGAWTLIDGTGTPHVGFWWLGLNMLRQMKRGY